MFAGAAVIRRQGIRTLDGLRGALNGGSLQEVNAADAALVYVAGLFLILPGFLSDLAGIALLIPPVRRMILGRLRSHVAVSETRVWTDGSTASGSAGHRGRGRRGHDATLARPKFSLEGLANRLAAACQVM